MTAGREWWTHMLPGLSNPVSESVRPPFPEQWGQLTLPAIAGAIPPALGNYVILRRYQKVKESLADAPIQGLRALQEWPATVIAASFWICCMSSGLRGKRGDEPGSGR